ncbi:Exocyst complex component SEC3A [Apostasia shenzhenica]|uniref:Exocyst complex component SEC3A n=1 Tax=Apostasia shenzhenica TaxID=1088818 RepID=A0A2I0AM48_9ASPA|nr:Exocyst complex component SEC3A [Apostasia shenzhenica]
MARSSADDLQLKCACDAAIAGSKHKVVLSIRVAKSRGIFGKSAKLGRQMAKARVLAITRAGYVTRDYKGEMLDNGDRKVMTHAALTTEKLAALEGVKAALKWVSKYYGIWLEGDSLQPAKLYKLKHLSKVEVIQNDPSGCTFMLVSYLMLFAMNRLLLCILNISKEVLGSLPKVVGIDIVEMALWAKENTPASTNKITTEDGVAIIQSDTQVTVEKDLVSQAEEEDMETLLGTYVMGVGEAEAFSERMKRELQALEAANVYALLESETLIEEVLQGLEGATICVEDMDEWLGIFNVKLKHMREDIESIEARNNKLELHFANNKALMEELDKLLERLDIPPKFSALLTDGTFDERRMVENIEACEWLTRAMHLLQLPNLDPFYANMQAVKEKRAELEKIKCTFVQQASEFLRNYFASLVDFMINEKSYFSQAREFSHELRASTKVVKVPTAWFESSAGLGQAANSAETSALTEAYSKMLTVFIPLLVDESSFFAHFMCFDVPGLSNGSKSGSDSNRVTGDGQEGMASGTNDFKMSCSTSDLGSLNDSLQELLDGIQEDFCSLVDWAFKIDPLRCISMHGVTERYLSGQKADTAGFVRLLLDDLETRISMNFNRFVDDCIYMIEKNERNARQVGVLPYIPRFAFLATRMEQYVQGQSRDLIDQTYTKIVSIMFVCLERTAQIDPKYYDIVLLENYAAFQNNLYDLANVVPTLAKFYHQASESYDQACTRHINMVIFITFERLFLFARRIEELMFTITPEEIQFQVGMSKADLRKMLKSSLSGLDKTINAMYKKLQKNLTSEELLPSLWEKCKKDFLDKYGSFVRLVNKIYPGESVPPVTEMRDLLAQM